MKQRSATAGCHKASLLNQDAGRPLADDSWATRGFLIPIVSCLNCCLLFNSYSIFLLTYAYHNWKTSHINVLLTCLVKYYLWWSNLGLDSPVNLGAGNWYSLSFLSSCLSLSLSLCLSLTHTHTYTEVWPLRKHFVIPVWQLGVVPKFSNP